MNKNELIQKVRAMKDITSDEKAYLIDLINTKKKYGLVWEDKPEDVEEQLRRELPVFKELKDKAIISDDPEAPNHILIEGDNLHALTALTYTHKGKIDVIYIDPPYNTGNKDFIYNDHYVDKEDSYRHSKWLSFMNKRLRLAHELLADDGVIFISIDDNEDSALKLLCDEIYNEYNFLGRLVWFKKRKGSFLSNYVVSMTEYILPYRKSNKLIQLYGAEPDKNETQPLIKRTNSINTLIFPENSIKTKLKNGKYEKGIYGKGTSSSNVLTSFSVEDGIIKESLGIEAPFIWTQTFLDNELKKGTEIHINTKNIQPRALRKNSDSVKAFSSFIDGRDFSATNEDAYENLKEIFNTDRPFQYSKPKELIKKLIRSKSFFKNELIVLDFMAGSGTTLHSVMELNKEDNIRATAIITTNNENNICEEVTYVRNKRVIQGYKNLKGEDVEGLTSNNLRYFQTDFVPSNINEQNRRLLTERSTELICIKEDCYTDVTKEHKSIKPHLARIFTDKRGKYLVVIYHSFVQYEVIQKLIEIIPTLETEEKVKVYSFSPEKETIDEEFISIIDKIESVPLPESIYNTYKQCFRAIKLDRETAVELEKTDDNVYLI